MLNIPENELQQVKTELRNTCERYCNIKVPYKQRQIIKSLSQREDITIMKADKGRGEVVMNKSKYLEKCLTLLKVNNLYDLMKILQKLMKGSYKECFVKSSQI